MSEPVTITFSPRSAKSEKDRDTEGIKKDSINSQRGFKMLSLSKCVPRRTQIQLAKKSLFRTFTTSADKTWSLSRRFMTSADYIAGDDLYGSHNYHPLPVVLCRGKGVNVFDVEGRRYLDFLAGYSAVNQGHCHERLVKVMQQQCEQLTLVSRAFHSNQFAPYAELMTKTFGYDRVLPMNTGVETGETALKLCRRWAYDVKGVKNNEALMIYPAGNFWGRTLAAISSSSDKESFGGFGPLLPGYLSIPYNDLKALEKCLEEYGHRVAAYMAEPIQGEAGVIVPSPGYLRGVRELCNKHNVLLVADEVQTGLARTGKMLACDWEDVKPDILLLGKALSGGMLPVSAILANSDIMLTIKPGQHGSTYGGNPLACAVASEAIKVIIDERMAENAQARGEEVRAALSKLATTLTAGTIRDVRGRGLLNAIEFKPNMVDDKGRPLSAYDICIELKDAQVRHGAQVGLLCKPTHEHTIRLAPPLIITKEMLQEALEIFSFVVQESLAGRNRKA
jgi:ornithine--oxo-acid transaminase